uniref:Cyclic nucleotide-binding domain-containing protein n=1 Tax=Heliothis virescens TaxID=7102 RepID=A0A2A4JX54_HELVI
MFVTINCVSCLWLLATHEGFCDYCNNPYVDVYYDWRAFIWHKLNETDEGYATFVYGAVFVFSFAIDSDSEEIRPSAITEFVMVCLFMVVGYVLVNFIFVPKAFAESTLRFRDIYGKYLHVKKVIEETERRNPTDNSHKDVKFYYKLLWEKRNCITTTPQFIFTLPRYLRVDVRQDLFWPLFYHSPTLRKTSHPFRRWITEATVIDFKLPGAKFFTNKESHGTLYYLKSGIIQFISLDDGVTPILSVTSGSVFGDVSFIVPHKRRKILVRCLTYCEFYYIPRKNFIIALHKYPFDRKTIMRDVKGRLDHAKGLFGNKKLIRGLDRNEDEGILWIKRRWWELYNIIDHFTQATGEPKETLKGQLPRDETAFHCSKYIGQLVLCNKTELQISSMFTNSKFPWIVNPRSRFGLVWYRIVSCTVLFVLFIHPQCLVLPKIPMWFQFFSFWTDTIYAIDIGVSLVTAVKKNESVTNNFATVVFERFKSLTFMLDMLSTIWFEDIFELCGAPQYYYTLQFNRLIKVYILFHGEYLKFNIRRDPAIDVFKQIMLIYSALFFICSHVVFEIMNYFPDLTMVYYYGEVLCSKALQVNCTQLDPIAGVAISWAFEWIYSENTPMTLLDVYVMVTINFIFFVVKVYCKGKYTSHLFLTHKEVIKYQHFVIHLKSYYQHYRIHQDLVKRLDRYLICHWRYYKGTDVMKPNTMENEARDIFWKAQGNLSMAIIGGSRVFLHADSYFIKELARVAKFLIMPKNNNILMFGTQCKNVSWVAQGYVKSEYADDKGEMITDYYGPGSILSIVEVFLGRVSLRSYTTATEVEIIYIPIKDFWDVYKKYATEKSYVDKCVQEYGGMYSDIFKKHVLKHRDLPYYDKRGLCITDKKKCIANYLGKGFVLDIAGAVPWFSVLKALIYKEITDDTTFLINTVCKFAHLYILFAYFDYITDIPTIIKWQIVNILLVMGVSHYLMINCVHFKFNEAKYLIDVLLNNETCWMPAIFDLPYKLDGHQLHLIFAQSLNLAECGMMRMNFGRFIIDRSHLGVGFILFLVGLLFWFISCYTLILLVLNERGNTLFQHSVLQLQRFLKSERVEPEVINRVMDHFRYCWLRTKGIDTQQLTNNRIGLVFRQDLSYYFYKKTFSILDSMFGGGEPIMRQLASVSDVAYFLPGHDIFREMDIVPNIWIVHRGRVNIYKEGKKMIILTKGDIFGQLQGVTLRPIKVTATADDHVDLLCIEVAAFQSIITDEWNEFPAEAEESAWYNFWLFLAWVVNPFVSSVLVLLFVLLPDDSDLWLRLYCLIFIMDAIDLLNFIAEFFTVELVVSKKLCMPRRFGVKKLKDWGVYVDALSLLLPLVTLFTKDWEYQAARLLRLKFFIDFEFHFCRGFRSQKAPYVLKFAIMLLLLHIFTCGWILFACRGCARSTRDALKNEHGRTMPSFVVPKFWPHDYVVAMTYILLIHTHTSIDTVMALSLKQIYYKVFVTFFMYLLDIWIMAVAINWASNRFRVMYAYDNNVQTMLTYLTNNGICVSLAEMVKTYTDQVWTRQRGDWLPELAYQAPLCLRQDLFTALYIHHLEAPPTYRRLPDYFKRQLCARFSRVVIFPGW